MAKRISIRKSKRNPDFYEVRGFGSTISVLSKREAKKIKKAKMKVKAKRKLRSKK
jgi:hypothetical protein